MDTKAKAGDGPGLRYTNGYTNAPLQGFVHHVCRLVAHARQHVGVGVQGDGYGGVPEEFLDDLGVHALAEEERGAGEAVLSGDRKRAKSAILEDFPYVGIWWRIYNELPNRPASLDRATIIANISESVEENYGGDYLWYALETAADEVQRSVAALCSPALTVEEGARDVSGVASRWNFKSLLGAMYLQMYWLMAAGSDLTRCEHCGLLISLARPRPEGRKRRRDKRFCDDACRQARHRSKKKS